MKTKIYKTSISLLYHSHRWKVTWSIWHSLDLFYSVNATQNLRLFVHWHLTDNCQPGQRRHTIMSFVLITWEIDWKLRIESCYNYSRKMSPFNHSSVTNLQICKRWWVQIVQFLTTKVDYIHQGWLWTSLRSYLPGWAWTRSSA